MSKAKQKTKISQLKRKQMIEEVFKKGKKQRDIAKKFDNKMAQKFGSGNKNKTKKFQELKQKKKSARNSSREQVVALNNKLDEIRANLKPN